MKRRTSVLLMCFVLLMFSGSVFGQSNLFGVDYDDSLWVTAEPCNHPGISNPMWSPVENSRIVVFRKEFNLDSDPVSATVDVKVDNMFCVMVNCFDPVDYPHLLEGHFNWRDLMNYDLTGVLQEGHNCIVILAIALGGYEGAFVELTVDDEVITSSSDGTWKCTTTLGDPLLFVAPGENTQDLPSESLIVTSFPNPFNPSTKISVVLQLATTLKVEVFNSLGQIVETLADNEFSAGQHFFNFSPKNLTSGAYYVRATTPQHQTKTQKIVMVE
jgi:Secretion system C-terminal sorting domain